MTREEAVKILQATRLMLMDGANQPISDLYYALDMAIEALEQTEPTSQMKTQNSNLTFEKSDEPQIECLEWYDKLGNYHRYPKDEPHIVGKHADVAIKDEPQTDCAWK